MDESAVNQLLDQVLAPWVRQLGLRAGPAAPDCTTLILPYDASLRHGGGVICGQVFMAAADTAMMVAIAVALGGFQPMTTVSLNTSFLRAVRGGDLRVVARVLRLGENLVFGAVDLYDSAGALAVQATSTYARLKGEAPRV
jgi:uncharacterized protein (TIGR00369 family)